MLGTPLIQSRPAGGAGTPFVCSDLAACSIAALGTRDHHLLTGLADDDHSIYALADKSRPSPWVAAGDLAARSVADLGIRDHHLLTGLADDDHAQYALLAGRAGGQTLKGGTTALNNLLLQSTAHATRGIVQSVDPLQVGTYSTDSIGIAVGTAPLAKVGVRIERDPADNSGGWGALVAMAGLTYSIPSNAIVGVGGKANIQDGMTNILKVFGLDFMAAHTGAHTATEVTCVAVQPYIVMDTSHAALVQGIDVKPIGAVVPGANITDAIGVNVRDFTQYAHNYTNAYGLKVAAPSRGTSRDIAWFGGATPLARVNAVTPAANQTALFLAEGVIPTQRRVEWKLYSGLVAGDRVMVLV